MKRPVIYYYDNQELDEFTYKIYLLNKYLTKDYGEENAIAILEEYSSNLDDLAKMLGAEDFSFFCLYFLSNIFVVKSDNNARQLADAHYELWEIANDVFIKDKFDKGCIIEPRGLAKTTIFNMAVNIWLVCYKKSQFTLVGAKKDSDAQQFLDSIKVQFNENQLIIKVFGKLIDKKKYTVNANEIEFTNGCYIRAVGSGTSVRGANFKGVRPQVVIADDYQSEDDILTEDARTKKYNRWTKEVEQVGDKAVFRNGKKIKSATKIIAIGTILHNDCLMSKLVRNRDYYTVLNRAILLDDNQKVEDVFNTEHWKECHKLYYNDQDNDSRNTAKKYYLEHKEEMQFPVLWPEKWDCFEDLAIPFWENRISFMSELMNDATAIGEKWFTTYIKRPSSEIEKLKFLNCALVVDPASTVTNRSDFTTMVVGSVAVNKYTYIRDMYMKRVSFDDYCYDVIDMLIKYQDITYVVIEKNVYSGADVLKIRELIENTPELRNRRFNFINENQRTNKDQKIETIRDPVNNGTIVFADCNNEFMQQILDFQGQLYSEHDSIVA